ncbi:hypothetical protein F4801DRAFT_573422 [Xylaria longipes]|nr:hypothetical protein F4801DRAFT_573422 [Xylaria longipes]
MDPDRCYSLDCPTDHDAHKIRRSAIASFFSKRHVADRQDVLCRNVGKLCQRISKLAGTTFNLGAAISAFARDAANEYPYGLHFVTYLSRSGH